MIFSLGAAYSRIRLPVNGTRISLPPALETTSTNFTDFDVLVDQNGNILVNQNGDTLGFTIVRSIQSGVVQLGA